MPSSGNIEEYDYPLPSFRIAQFPLDNRDESKLLIWKHGELSESTFSKIGGSLPENSSLVFNNTKVIRARLIFSKMTGATIEVFCLEPLTPTTEVAAAFAQTISCKWKCLVGNVKRWKDGILEKSILVDGDTYSLFAEKTENLGDGCFSITFSWSPSQLPFSEIIALMGIIPLPPYISRAAGNSDTERYQTIYAKHEGSVAAPTAGLHFTESTLKTLRNKNIDFYNVTLHVGIGTFRPVSVKNIAEHLMHFERISIELSILQGLIKNSQKPVFAVGTTSVRTLESLYWLGVKLIVEGDKDHPIVNQWDAYDERYAKEISYVEALRAIRDYLIRTGKDQFNGETALMIVPSYQFRAVEGMITNFHMPQSTLLLLVAAFIGQEWKVAYEYALNHNFRFLSYGDACLFFRRH